MPARPIYLDNHATTKTDPRVLAAMLPYFTELYGNSASVSHRFGWDAGDAVDRAREQVAKLLGAETREIVFTSGATEANNLAIKGSVEVLKKRGNHLISATNEHKAVLDPMKRLAREGWNVTLVDCEDTGLVSVESIEAAITDSTILISVMAANNEVGTINPTREIGELCHAKGIIFHTDATQAIGKIPLDVQADHIDLASLTGHKFYGPKGIGALFIRRKDPQVRISPLFDGGGHERGMRSGTLAVPLIVGLGEACRLAIEERDEEARRILDLRERLHEGLAQRIEAISLNGHSLLRVPGNLNLSFGYVDGEALMMAMREIAVSSGSACSAANPEPSHVLLAMGVDEDMARASLRFGLGRFTTEEEIDFAIKHVAEAVERLRPMSASWMARSGN